MKPSAYPKLKFITNAKLDKQMAWHFFNEPIFGGFNFWKNQALYFHPELKDVQTKHVLNKYIEQFYKDTQQKRDVNIQKIQTIYSKNEPEFFRLVDELFKGHTWPKGKYIAYVSIFGFGPRFLDTKIFQYCYLEKNGAVFFTIYHELLHFMFYDYCKTKHKKIFGKLDTESGPFWDLAEIFNTVIQSTKDFEKLQFGFKTKGYPAHQKIISKAKKAWHGDIDEWIQTFAVDYLKQNRA